MIENRHDTFLFQGKRKNMIEVLRKKGIHENVLKAMEKVLRHLFFHDSTLIHFAYDEESAYHIGEGQTISRPSTVAMQTQYLEIKKGEKVLEIGTGSGYQTAVLIEMGAKVFTVERQRKLYDRTKEFLPTIGYNARFFYGDGYKGLVQFAPFDKIIVTAGAPFVPKDLLIQLKEETGILVIPVGEGESQVMNIIKRKKGMEFEKKELGTFKFVPLLKDKR
jgi:protein-L-isoaspartate(D-aspartate) O-methyltransferase